MSRDKGFTRIYCGKVEDVLPRMSGKAFDLITLIDVLEHLDDDVGTLSLLGAALRDGGAILATVPAHPFLWSSHDLAHHHKRRYRMGELLRNMEAAGLRTSYASYFNMWLFPVVAGVRMVKRGFGASKSGDDLFLPGPLVNDLLYRLFSSESRLIGRMKLPMGVSIVAIAVPRTTGKAGKGTENREEEGKGDRP